VAFFDLEEAMTKVVAHYSHGMRKKLAVAAALIHEPEIVFLDEPFEGMDAAAVDATATLIEQLAANGTTIFITSHRLELIERICTSVAILAAGDIVLRARTSELAAAVRTVPSSSRPLLESIFLELTGTESKRSLSWLQQGVAR
jgi:ABC-2 type transport system ATP-binding protein